MFKIWSRLKKWEKKWEKVFRFSDNCIWIRSGKFLQSPKGYLWSTVNVLTNSPKISPKTRGEIFWIKISENNEKTWLKCSQEYFASIWISFTCSLSKRSLKRCFLESPVATFFTVCYFGNTLAMKIIFSFKMFNIWCRFQKCKKKKNKQIF